MAISSHPVVETSLPVTRSLARWARSLRFDDIPAGVRHHIVTSIRDGLGCAVYGSTLPWTVATRKALAATSVGGTAVWGTRERLPAPQAALANGVAVHAFELDDLNRRALGVHATACILPALLAVAELRPLDGRELVVASAVGHEVAVRLAQCMGWSMFRRGWQTPPIFGAIAAAAAVGRAARLDETTLAQAIAIAALQATGLTAAKRRGMIKRLYAGRAAEIGLVSALLAEAGCDAPEDVLEAPGGFCETFAGPGGYELETLIRRLGLDLAASDIQFKLYAACGAVHAALDALRELREELPDITPRSVRGVEVGLSTSSHRSIGAPYSPVDTTTAQFSVAYSVAVTLLEGDAFVDQFRPNLLTDSSVLELADRVRAFPDAAIDALGLEGRNAARVRVMLDDGRAVERTYRVAKAASERELREKFDRLARPVLGIARAEELARTVDSLEELSDASILSGLASLPDSSGGSTFVDRG